MIKKYISNSTSLFAGSAAIVLSIILYPFGINLDVNSPLWVASFALFSLGLMLVNYSGVKTEADKGSCFANFIKRAFEIILFVIIPLFLIILLIIGRNSKGQNFVFFIGLIFILSAIFSFVVSVIWLVIWQLTLIINTFKLLLKIDTQLPNKVKGKEIITIVISIVLGLLFRYFIRKWY